MTREEMYWTLRAMETFGGSFVQALGHLYETADQINKEIVITAFSSYFETYKQKGLTLKTDYAQRAAASTIPPADSESRV
jgi:hypothetical protein